MSSRRNRIAFIHSGAFYHLADLADAAVRAYDLVELYAPEMDEHSLDGVDAVFLAARQHPDVMAEIAPYILDFIARSGTKLYVDGENRPGSWLPGVGEIHRGTNFWAWRTGEDLGRRSINPEHYLWNYLNDMSVHWHYHAVLEPPSSATPLVVLEEIPGRDSESGIDPWGGQYLAVPNHPNVLLFHDSQQWEAEVVVSTMDCSYHHGAGFMPGASQLLYRMLNWLSVPPEVDTAA